MNFGRFHRPFVVRPFIENIATLEEALSEPTQSVVDALRAAPGDIVVLGVGGKMGPSLAHMARRAATLADGSDSARRVVGVARFSAGDLEAQLNAWGVETQRADLLGEGALASLPDAPNVIFMAGMKFGSSGQQALTWAMNAYLPALVAQRYARSRIVAFSTGNVYGLSPITDGGLRENDELAPVGEYAMSCLGRERIFEHFSRTHRTAMAMIRLNYAMDLRYGVLVDLARRIGEGETIDLDMGHFNVIWQGDANAYALAALGHASSPPWVLNVAGPETLSVRRCAEQLAQLMDCEVQFCGQERPDALLSSGARGHRLFGYPRVTSEQLLHWTAHWVKSGGQSLGKPTHFEARDGRF